MKRKKKDIFEDGDTDLDKDFHQATILNSSKKKDSCTSVDLKVEKKQLPEAVGENSKITMCDKTNDQWYTGSTEVSLSHKGNQSSQACNVVGSDQVKEKTNNKNNVAAVGDDYQNKVDEYFFKLQAKYPNDKILYMTYGQRLHLRKCSRLVQVHSRYVHVFFLDSYVMSNVVV